MASLRIFHRMLYVLSWVFIVHSVTNDAELICPEGFRALFLPNNQYYTPKICIKPVATALNFSKAEQVCAGEHGTLLTLNIFSLEETRDVVDTLIEMGMEEGWLGMKKQEGKLWWRDETFEQVYYDPNSPSWQWSPSVVYNGTNRCASFTLKGDIQPRRVLSSAPFELSLGHCSDTRPFVCMTRGLSPVPQPVNWCEDGWLSSPDETDCLQFVTDSGTFQESRRRCRGLNAQVVQPKTEIITELVANLLRDDERELAPDVDPLPSPGLTCYGCDYSTAALCLENARVETCTGTQICQTRSTLENGALMLAKTCEPSYHCDENRKNSESTCNGDVNDPVCYDCCEEPRCNKGIPRNGLTESLGIQPVPFSCFECKGTSVEDCKSRWTRETCDENQSVCLMRWERQANGDSQLTMGCATQNRCWSDLQLSASLCSSSVQNPQCGVCCNGSLCNDSPPTMELLMKRYDARGSRQKRQTGAMDTGPQISPVWVGLRYSGGKFTWTDGSPLPEDHELYEFIEPGQENEELCVTLDVIDTFTEWGLVKCNDDFPVVCSKSAKPDKGLIIAHPRDITTAASDFQLRAFRGTDAPFRLTCEVENVHQDKDVMWVKDGSMYTNNGLPPDGLTLEFNQATIGGLPDPQGTYQCMAWGIKPFQRLTSQPATLLFSDFLNFVGTIRLRNAQKNPLDLAYENLNDDLLGFQNSIIQGLTELTILPIKTEHTVSIKRYRRGLIVDFYLRYQLQVGSGDSGLREMISELSATTSVPRTLSQYEIFLVLEDLVLKTALRKLIDGAADPGSIWSSQYGVRSGDIQLNSTVACPAMETVDAEGSVLQWPRTRVGQEGRTEQVCMSDGQALYSAPCEGGVNVAADWGSATAYTGCKQPPESDLTDQLKKLEMMPVDEAEADRLAGELEKITGNTAALTSTDLIYVSRILKNIVSTPAITTKISRKLMRTMNNLLKVNSEVNADAQMIDKAQTRSAHAIEHFSNKVDLQDQQEELVITDNIAMEIWAIKPNTNTPPVRGFGTTNSKLSTDSVFGVTSVGDVDLSSAEVVIFFPDEVLNLARNLEENLRNIEDLPNIDRPEDLVARDVRLTYFIYGKADLFISPSQLMDQDQYQGTNSEIVSGSISGLYLYNLTEPVVIAFNPLQKNLTDRSYCAYWDYEANDGYGNWSTDGCYSNGTVNGRIICLCNHLTNFAILTDFQQGAGISAINRTILGFITIIGLCLSIAGLALTILSFVLFRKLRKGRSQKVLVNLALALLCTNVVFLIGIERTESYEGCIAVAALLHYFLLAAFMWMLMEGILQYLKFVKVLDNYVENFMWKATIPSWGLPAVVVAIVAGIDYRLYRGPENYCWLDLQVFYFAFMVPVGAIILTNAILFILVVKGITCDRPKQIRSTQSDRSLALLQCRAGICCFIILGLTWVFGFFAIEDARIVFQYLFCIFNALQGFLIFVFHNIREPAVRRAWIGLCCKGEKDAKNLSSSYGINTDSTGGKPPSSLTNPSVQLDKMYDNAAFKNGTRDNSTHI